MGSGACMRREGMLSRKRRNSSGKRLGSGVDGGVVGSGGGRGKATVLMARCTCPEVVSDGSSKVSTPASCTVALTASTGLLQHVCVCMSLSSSLRKARGSKMIDEGQCQ